MNMRRPPPDAIGCVQARAMSGLPAAAVDTYASRWDDIMDPLGDDAARVEEFFRYLHLILTHKPRRAN